MSLLRLRHAPAEGSLGSRWYVIPCFCRTLTDPAVAHKFDPDRFLDERVSKYLTPNPFIFLPFNAGPRICLGQQFAYNEMSFFLVRLLQQFDRIELDEHSQPPDARVPAEWAGADGRKGFERFWPKAHLTLYSKVRGIACGLGWVADVCFM